MRRLVQLTFISMGLLLGLTTALLQLHRDGEGVPSLIVMQGEETRRLILMRPLTQHVVPLTPSVRGLSYIAWTPNGLLYTASSGRGDVTLYRVASIGATPEILADQLLSRMVVSANGEWVVVADSGGLGGNYGLRAIRTDGIERYPLTLELQEDLEINQDMTPVVAPDGAWVAFAVYAPSGDFDVYRVRHDGTDLKNLTADLDGVGVPLAWAVDASGLILVVERRLYRADMMTGTMLPLLPQSSDVPVKQSLVAQNAAAGLLIIQVDDTSLHGIRFDGTPVWEQPMELWANFQPDGAWGFVIQQNQRVRMWGASGATLPIQSLDPNLVWIPQWSSDGYPALVYGDDGNGSSQLWQFEPTSGRFERIWGIEGGLIITVAWSPDGSWIVANVLTSVGRQLFWIQPDRHEVVWQSITFGFRDLGGVGWGPPYQKTWSAGLLWAIGLSGVIVGGVVPRLSAKRRLVD